MHFESYAALTSMWRAPLTDLLASPTRWFPSLGCPFWMSAFTENSGGKPRPPWTLEIRHWWPNLSRAG